MGMVIASAGSTATWAGTRAVIPAAGSVEHRTQVWGPPQGCQALLRTRWTMISPGTELAFYQGTHSALLDPEVTWAKYPMFPGYAAVSEVVATGDASPLEPGQLVFHLGNHATACVVDPTAELVLPVPDGMDLRWATFARLAQIGATAATRVSTPRRVLVLGAGMVGNLAAQRFQLDGARVAIVDTAPSRLALAQACGLQRTCAGPADSDAVRDLLDGPPDCVVEATGVPSLIAAALRSVAWGGTVILLGSPRGSLELDAYKLVHLKATRLVGAHECALPLLGETDSRRWLASRALADIAARRLVVDPMLTHVITPDRLMEAYDRLVDDRDRWLGVLVDWSAG